MCAITGKGGEGLREVIGRAVSLRPKARWRGSAG